MLAPVEVVEIEIGEALPRLRPAPGARSGAARALVRLHGRPLGLVDLPLAPGGLSPRRMRAARLDRASSRDRGASGGRRPRARDHPDGGRLPTGRGPAPCAAAHGAAARARPHRADERRDRDARPARPARALPRLRRPSRPPGVRGDRGRQRAGHDRHARPRRPCASRGPLRARGPAGLAAAHNRGLAEAGGAIVAITDDDVTVDARWLLEIAAGFARDPRIGCVTGLILPAELRTPAQVWADRHWGVAKGFRERLYTRPLRRLSVRPYPYTAGCFGSGANMAFRAAPLRARHGFDPGMGTGTPARGGDDLAAFFAVIASGHALLFTPAALVWHWYAEASTRCAARRTATAPASPRTSRRSSPTTPSGS